MQSLASRAHALLSLQPISDADALKLDRSVAAKVHAISGFPWIFNSEIATLPVSLHGFEFPSIRSINVSIAVDGLARDLNHHIISYCNLVLITLADWTCTLNNCTNPLVEPGISKNFSRRMHFNTIPAAWIIAQKEMDSMKPLFCLHSTDQSHILNGDVSISHVLKIHMIIPHLVAPHLTLCDRLVSNLSTRLECGNPSTYLSSSTPSPSMTCRLPSPNSPLLPRRIGTKLLSL